MKDREVRDAMVAKVNAVYAKYPDFLSLPEVKGNIRCVMSALDQRSYVQALYAVCSNGEVVGRSGNYVEGNFTEAGTTDVANTLNPTTKKERTMKAESGR